MEILKDRCLNGDDKVIILGNFDGLHKGHQKLINQAITIAKEKRLKSALFTFNRHPSYVIAKNEPVPLIFTKYEKQMVLEDSGIDYYIEYPFTIQFAKTKPDEFIKNILIDEMRAKAIVVGSDYHFGHKGMGDIELLKKLSAQYGFELIVLEKERIDGREISSSWIREEIIAGNMEKAAELLGRTFLYIGDVVRGEQIGRTIGYPTANLVPSANKILPPLGVYHTEVIIDHQVYIGLTNIGCKPTVSGKSVTVETYILDFDEMIYKKEIIICVKRFLRSETKFSNLHELRQQINLDLLDLYKQ